MLFQSCFQYLYFLKFVNICILKFFMAFILSFHQEMEVIVPDPTIVYSSSGIVESKSVVTLSSLQKQDGQRGLFVDRGVGSPRLVKSPSLTTFTVDQNVHSEAKVCIQRPCYLRNIRLSFTHSLPFCWKLWVS